MLHPLAGLPPPKHPCSGELCHPLAINNVDVLQGLRWMQTREGKVGQVSGTSVLLLFSLFLLAQSNASTWLQKPDQSAVEEQPQLLVVGGLSVTLWKLQSSPMSHQAHLLESSVPSWHPKKKEKSVSATTIQMFDCIHLGRLCFLIVFWACIVFWCQPCCDYWYCGRLSTMYALLTQNL